MKATRFVVETFLVTMITTEILLATEKLKRLKSPSSKQIPAEMIKAEGRTNR
jgi:hypothetical protein